METLKCVKETNWLSCNFIIDALFSLPSESCKPTQFEENSKFSEYLLNESWCFPRPCHWNHGDKLWMMKIKKRIFSFFFRSLNWNTCWNAPKRKVTSSSCQNCFTTRLSIWLLSLLLGSKWMIWLPPQVTFTHLIRSALKRLDPLSRKVTF